VSGGAFADHSGRTGAFVLRSPLRWRRHPGAQVLKRLEPKRLERIITVRIITRIITTITTVRIITIIIIIMTKTHS